MIVDTSSTDLDTLNVTAINATSVSASTVISGVEKINLTTALSGGQTFTVNADKFSGVQNLKVTRGDLLDGQISGKGQVDFAGVNGTKVAAIEVVGNGTAAVNVTQVTAPGVTVTADGTGNVTLNGAGTVNAANATGTVTVDGTATAALAAGAVVVNAAKATTVNVGQTNAVTGAVTVNADKATTVAVTAAGGATINASSAVAAGTAITVGLTAIDDSGATVTLGTSGSQNATTGTITRNATVNLAGTTATTDTATVAAAGFINVNAGSATASVDALTLKGTGAALDVALSLTTGAITSIAATGTDAVTVRAAADTINGKTVTGLDTLVVGAFTGVGAAVTLDKVSTSTKINVAADLAQTITVATGANVIVSANQSDLTLNSKTDKGTLNLVTADDNAYDGLPSTISVGALNLNTATKTFSEVNITADAAALSATTFTAGTDGVVKVTGSKAVTITGGYNAGTPAASSTVAKSIDASAVTGIVTMNIGAGVNSVNTGSAADVLVVDDRSVALGAFVANGAVVYTVNAGAGNNNTTLTSFGVGSQFVSGAGNDTVTIGHANSAVVSTGAGTDSVRIAHDINSDSVIVAGEGTDTLTFQDTDGNNFAGNTNFAFSGFENVNIAALTAGTIKINSAQFANNATFTLTGTAAGTDTLEIVGKDTVGATADTINASGITLTDAFVILDGGAGDDTVTGTAGADTIVGGLGSDTLTGGEGTDTVTYATLLAGSPTDSTNPAATAVQGVVVNLGATALTGTAVFAGVGQYLATGVASVAGGKTAYTFAGESANNSSVQDTLASLENVTGSAGKDYIVGSIGANVITGGLGRDYLVGGAGADTFVLLATAADADTIADFATTTDKISLSKAAFAGLGSIVGAGLSVGTDLVVNATGAAAAATDRLILNNTNGQLSYDADGTGATAAVLIATLTGVTTLAAADFIIAV